MRPSDSGGWDEEFPRPDRRATVPVPIVDDRELLGIVTRRDVLRLVARREPIFQDATARRP